MFVTCRRHAATNSSVSVQSVSAYQWSVTLSTSLVPRRSRLGQSWTLPWAVTSPRERLGTRLAFSNLYPISLNKSCQVTWCWLTSQLPQGGFISSHDWLSHCPLEFFFFPGKRWNGQMGRLYPRSRLLYAYCWNRSPTLLAEINNHQALVRLRKWRRTYISEGNLGHSDVRWFTKLLLISLGISCKDHITKVAVRQN